MAEATADPVPARTGTPEKKPLFGLAFLENLYEMTMLRQIGLLVGLAASVAIGFAVVLWWQGAAAAGDIALVVTSFFVLQGYLRDVGQHIRNLQRAVNDMEELVAIHGEPIGIADAPDARPIDIQGGRIVFDRGSSTARMRPVPWVRSASMGVRGCAPGWRSR